MAMSGHKSYCGRKKHVIFVLKELSRSGLICEKIEYLEHTLKEILLNSTRRWRDENHIENL
jgi:hypothetical protein